MRNKYKFANKFKLQTKKNTKKIVQKELILLFWFMFELLRLKDKNFQKEDLSIDRLGLKYEDSNALNSFSNFVAIYYWP